MTKKPNLLTAAKLTTDVMLESFRRHYVDVVAYQVTDRVYIIREWTTYSFGLVLGGDIEVWEPDINIDIERIPLGEPIDMGLVPIVDVPFDQR